MSPDTPESRPGLFNVLRFIAVLAVLALALLAVLVVFDIVPRSALADLSTKIVLLAIVVALASAAIGFLMRGNRP
jgi:hypothetical protein